MQKRPQIPFHVCVRSGRLSINSNINPFSALADTQSHYYSCRVGEVHNPDKSVYFNHYDHPSPSAKWDLSTTTTCLLTQASLLYAVILRYLKAWCVSHRPQRPPPPHHDALTLHLCYTAAEDGGRHRWRVKAS